MLCDIRGMAMRSEEELATRVLRCIEDEMPTEKPKGAEGVCPLCYHNYNEPAGKCKGHTEKRKCGLSKPLGHGETCIKDFGHSDPCDHRDWKCAKCGKVSQFKDGLCWDCFGGDPGQ
jgi:hypothetical protein